ncbi:MAG: FkbM family methyltransferase [Planctomycetota bacterium]|nr:FkbM family methyltransferase [Planctomycetota bacterium]
MNIFLDCGTHYFEGLLRLVRKYQMDEMWKMFTFEGSPDIFASKLFVDALKVLSTQYNIVAENKCVGGVDEEVEFVSPKSQLIGLRGSVGNYFDIPPEDCLSRNVQQFSLATFIKRNFSKKDFIVCKLDIEGSEFRTVEELFETGAMSYINDIYVEWHVENRWGHQWPTPWSTEKIESAIKTKKRLEECRSVRYREWA